MPVFLTPRFAIALCALFTVATGIVIQPQAATAFVLGAWVGLVAAGPVLVVLWALGLIDLSTLVRPLTRLPVLIVLSLGLLWMTGTLPPAMAGAAGGAGALWWLRRGLG